MNYFFNLIKNLYKKSLFLQRNEHLSTAHSFPINQLNESPYSELSNTNIQDQIFHRNGHVREAALNTLSKEPQKNLPALMPLLIPRMNDHVPIIRQKAALLFEDALQSVSVGDLLAHHKLIERFCQTKHLKETDFMAKIHVRIKETPLTVLLQVLIKCTPPEQIFLLKAFVREIEQDESFFVSVLESMQPTTKRWFAAAVGPWYFSSARITKLLRDSSSFLKQAALRKVTQTDLHLHKDDLIKLMYDRAKRVRTLARFGLRSFNDLDIHQTYLTLLEGASLPSTGVILGFLEVATLEDTPRIKSYLSHTTKTIRATALISLHTQSSPGTTEAVLKSLFDKSSFVRKAAVNLAQKSPTSLENEVRSLMFEAPDYAKGACFGLLIRRRNFQALLDILIVLVTDQQTLEEKALTELKQWSIGQHTTPSKALYENILVHIDLFEAVKKPSYKAWLCDNAYRWGRLKTEIKWIGYK